MKTQLEFSVKLTTKDLTPEEDKETHEYLRIKPMTLGLTMELVNN